jgi:uncharacterized membrane protein SpoIIM required for sporulation
MSKSKYKIYNGKSLKTLFNNSKIYLMTLVFILGLIAGASTLNSESEITDKISIIIDSYIYQKTGQGMLNNFFNSLAVNAIFFISNLFFAFSLIGTPFIITLPMFKGFGAGCLCGYLYVTYRLTGLIYSVLMICPGAIISAFAFIMACNDSCEYSKNAYLKAIKSKGQYEKEETRVYLTRQLVFSGICIVSSAIDSIAEELFSKFFQI